MRIGFVVNDLDAPKKGLTTYQLAAECIKAGHEVWLTTAGRFEYGADDRIRAAAVTAAAESFGSADRFVDVVRSARRDRIVVDDLDVLMLRNNPAAQQPWARQAGLQFARIAAERGVLVLNDPEGLARARNKLYLLAFPEAVRARTLVTRDRAQIEAFLEEEGRIVLKPLAGYGGAGVFVVTRRNAANLGQIVSALSRDGHIVAQAYLPAAERGDLRLFLLNGRPLKCRGRYAVVFRRRTGEDLRSNVYAGGEPCRGEVTDAVLAVADGIRERLVEDGMFLVGADVAGDKLMELNIFSPGGLGDAGRFEKVNFVRAVREALERKASLLREVAERPPNAVLATQ